MRYVKFNIDEELRNAAKGKKTKLPVCLLLYWELADYPHIQRLIGRHFSITES